MKLISAITIAFLAVSSVFATHNPSSTGILQKEADNEALSDFEKAVEIIKKYETLHQPRHWPLVGYGHKVLPGEKFSRTKAMSEAEAEKLLRKDLLKNCAVFREFGADSLILGVLAYNIGSGATLRSSVVRKLRVGNRDIYESYVAHSRYRGKVHSQLQRRRIEEFNILFIKEADDTAKSAKNSIKRINTFSTKQENAKEMHFIALGCLNSADLTERNVFGKERGTHKTELACISRLQQ